MFLTQPAWFVDPRNVSGTASDSNNGATSITALLTKAELLRRIGAQNGPIQVGMVVTFLSDEPPGVGARDIINIDTSFGAVIWNMPLAVVQSGNLTAATAKNRAAGVAGRQTVTAALGFTQGLIFEDTTLNARSYIRSTAAAGAPAVICSLVQFVAPTLISPSAGFGNVQVDPVAGDAYRVLQPGNLNMQYAESDDAIFPIAFSNAHFTGSTDVFAELFIGNILLNFCSFQSFLLTTGDDGLFVPNLTNSFSANGARGFNTDVASTYEGGAILSGVYGAFLFDGDVLLQGSNGLVSGTGFSLACLENFFALGFRSANGGKYLVKGGDYGPPAVWGDRMILYPEAQVFYQWDRLAVQTFLCMILFDFAGGPSTPANAFARDNLTGAFVGPIGAEGAPISPALLDTPVGAGGFGGFATTVRNAAYVNEQP